MVEVFDNLGAVGLSVPSWVIPKGATLRLWLDALDGIARLVGHN
jgi:hypothetical protein